MELRCGWWRRVVVAVGVAEMERRRPNSISVAVVVRGGNGGFSVTGRLSLDLEWKSFPGRCGGDANRENGAAVASTPGEGNGDSKSVVSSDSVEVVTDVAEL